jgi:hypothetical protein
MPNITNLAQMARVRMMQKAWKYYKGDFSQALPVRRGGVNDNVTLNYCRNIVDKGVAFLFGKEPQFSQDADDATDLTEQEIWLDEVWKANKKMTLLSKVGIQGGVTGHVFIKILPGTPYPRIVLLDTQNVTVQTDPGDVETVLSYTIEYQTTVANGPGFHRQVIERRDADSEDWAITDYERAQSSTVWVSQSTSNWPYKWSPIVDCQNIPLPNEYYGLPDLPIDILALNDSINLSASNIARILKHHANPKTWGRGFRATEVESNVENFLIIPNDTAEVKNLEMHSDLASSLHFLEELEVEMHEASRMPEIALGKIERLGAITGVALAVLHSPLLEKTELKQSTYGDMIITLNMRLLEMGKFGSTATTTIIWPKLLPTDPLAERQAAVLDKNLGVSTETILSTLGYDAAQEMQRSLQEAVDQAHRDAQVAIVTGAQTPAPQGGAASTTAQRGAEPSDPGTGNNGVTPISAVNQVTSGGVIDSVKTAQYESGPTISGNGR